MASPSKTITPVKKVYTAKEKREALKEMTKSANKNMTLRLIKSLIK